MPPSHLGKKDQHHVLGRRVGKGGGDHCGKMLLRSPTSLVVTIIMILMASQFYQLWKFSKDESNSIIGRRDENNEMMIMPKNNDINISRAELLVAIQSLTKEEKHALLHDVLLEVDPHMVVTTNRHHPTAEELPRKNNDHATNNIPPTDYLTSALGSLTAEETENIINTVNGNEYQYRLSCPNYEDTADILKAAPGNTSRSVIIGYHIGMLHNWRAVVKDQLNTLYQCGLGLVADHMFISYSHNTTLGEELDELKTMLNRYTFARDATIHYIENQPIEGLAINKLHEDCTKRVEEDSPHGSETVAFYFHTKGTSRFQPDWESRFGEPYTYSTVLYWRKYMEYFTIERPYLCMKQIFDDGKFGCGVKLYPGQVGWWPAHYSGNFWATSCSYLSSLNPLVLYPLNDVERRADAEFYLNNGSNVNFVSLNEPVDGDLYNHLVLPRFYSDYSKIWHPDWVQQ